MNIVQPVEYVNKNPGIPTRWVRRDERITGWLVDADWYRLVVTGNCR